MTATLLRRATEGPVVWTDPPIGWSDDGWTGPLVAGRGHAGRRITAVTLVGDRPWDDGRPLDLTLCVNDRRASTQVGRGRFAWTVDLDIPAFAPVRFSLTTDRTVAPPPPDVRALGVLLDRLSFVGASARPRPRQVAADWARVLDLPGLGPDDDILAVGADSFGITTLAAWYAAETGHEIPETLFFEAPTPRAFADVLPAALGRLARSDPAPAHFVPLQPWGDRRPVFLVPGGAGGAAHLSRDAQVVARAGRDRPVYGLWLRDRPARAPADWIAAAAACAYAEMRVLGDPPWLLYALCGGAPIAWEIARLAIARGDGRPALLLVDGAIPPNDGESAVSPLDVDLTLGWVESIRRDWPFAERWEQIAPGAPTVVFPGDAGAAHDVYTGRLDDLGRALAEWADAAEARLLAGIAAGG